MNHPAGHLCTFPAAHDSRAPLFFLSCLFPLLLSSPFHSLDVVCPADISPLDLSFLLSAVVHFSSWGLRTLSRKGHP